MLYILTIGYSIPVSLNIFSIYTVHYLVNLSCRARRCLSCFISILAVSHTQKVRRELLSISELGLNTFLRENMSDDDLWGVEEDAEFWDKVDAELSSEHHQIPLD